MDAFAQPQDRSATIGPRFDYLALAPAAAAICYPVLLRAFHAFVGTQAATHSPLAIVGATFILAAAFAVPFLALALACRPDADPGARRLAYAGGPNALCLSWRRSGPDSQPYPRRNRVVRALARNRDLVTDRPQSRRCNAADRGALARARLRAITRPGSIHARRQMRAAPHLL